MDRQLKVGDLARVTDPFSAGGEWPGANVGDVVLITHTANATNEQFVGFTLLRTGATTDAADWMASRFDPLPKET